MWQAVLSASLTCTRRLPAGDFLLARTRRWVCSRRLPASGPVCGRTAARSWSWEDWWSPSWVRSIGLRGTMRVHSLFSFSILKPCKIPFTRGRGWKLHACCLWSLFCLWVSLQFEHWFGFLLVTSGSSYAPYFIFLFCRFFVDKVFRYFALLSKDNKAMGWRVYVK